MAFCLFLSLSCWCLSVCVRGGVTFVQRKLRSMSLPSHWLLTCRGSADHTHVQLIAHQADYFRLTEADTQLLPYYCVSEARAQPLSCMIFCFSLRWNNQSVCANLSVSIEPCEIKPTVCVYLWKYFHRLSQISNAFTSCFASVL